MTTRVALLPANLDPLLPGSIDAYVVTGVPLCGPDTTAGALHDLLVGGVFESAADIAVCTYDDTSTHHLLGLIPLERALAAPHDALACDLMDPDPPVVRAGADQEVAEWTAVKHGRSSLAVVSSHGAFRGLVPPGRLLRAMLTEHDRDLARLGGFLASSPSARHAMDEPVSARLWHRLPWLVLGMFGAAAATLLVRGFEGDLVSDIRLAFFIPGVVYLADAVGTQTEALFIRGLSVGVGLRRVFRLEALTGLLVGLIVAAATLPAVWLTMGSASLAFTVSLALVAACSVATVVAMTLPWLMSRLGHDPALGSGPLATVVQDLLSLVIYLAIAGALMA